MHTLPDGWQPGAYAGIGEVTEGPGTPERRSDRPDPQQHARSGGMGQRRVLVHASGFRKSPYADIRPAGPGVATPRKLWHSSPGSSGR